MAVTLAQAKNLSQDKLDHHVIDEFRKDPLLDRMIFDDTANPQGGQSFTYVYNRVSEYPTAQFRDFNQEYTPHEAKTKQYVANLKILGGSFEIDRVIQNHQTGLVNLLEFQLKQKIEAAKALFADSLINGDSGTDALMFDGLEKAIVGSTTDVAPDSVIDLSSPAAIKTNGEALIYYLDQLISELTGTPDVLMVSRKAYAAIKSAASYFTQFQTDKDNFGRPLVHYGGVPILELGDKPGTSNPIIATDTTEGTTSIYAARIALDGFHAISPVGQLPIKTYMPNMELPGVMKKGEVELVTAMALKATRAAGVLRNIKIA